MIARSPKSLVTLLLLSSGGGLYSPEALLAQPQATAASDWVAQEPAAQPSPAALPMSVADAVLDAIAKDFNRDRTQLQIRDSQPRLWSDGCLGLGPIGTVCQEVLVVGWQVSVLDTTTVWVYRTNNSGSFVQWDQAGTSLAPRFTLPSAPMADNAPPPLPKGAIFRGITPQGSDRQVIVLFKNGQVRQGQLGEETQQTQTIAELSRKTVKQFQAFLRGQQFSQFHQRCFGPGLETGWTYLSSPTVDVCYQAQEMDRLPPELQTVIAQWQTLTTSDEAQENRSLKTQASKDF